MSYIAAETQDDQIALLNAEADRYSRTSMVPAFKRDIRLAASRKEHTLRAAVAALQRYARLREAAQDILTRHQQQDHDHACAHGVSYREPCYHCIEQSLAAALGA